MPSPPPKLPHHLIEAALDAVGEIFIERHFADKVIEKRFRATPQWGSRDRRLFAETVYDLVRWWRWMWHLAGLPPAEYLAKEALSMERLWIVWAAYWIDKGHELPRWPEIEDMNADKHRRRSGREVPAAVRHSIPDWLDERGAAELGDDWPRVRASLNEPAPVFLRANTLKAAPGKVCHLLIEEGFECATVPGLPDALQMAKRQNVFPSKAFKEGLFEVQDAGSQRIAPFLDARPGMRVIDACAGAGGKSLHLAALMQNKGRILAMDTIEWKLKELRKRAARANAQNLEARLIEGHETIKRQHDLADRVLLDVPCSGLGVMRRNPDAKWKVDGLFTMADEELDYAFTLAKTLGARAISSEISHEEKELKRLGSFADKHQMLVGYHGHATTKPEHWEAGFALAKFNGANVDLGHFVAGNNTSPVPFIKKYHDRITHVHVKDRKMHDGPNTPLGEGDTPIAEVLRLIRDNKWPIQATIEFEYKVPEGSDRMKEIAKCVKFCRDALA